MIFELTSSERNCRLVGGFVFDDTNDDGIFNEAESELSNTLLMMTGIGYSYSSNSGNYLFSVPYNYTGTIYSELNSGLYNGSCDLLTPSLSQTYPRVNP